MSDLVFRPEAEADLAAIALHVAEHSRERALALVARLRRRCDMLAAHPQAGRPRNELGDGLRSIAERPYILIYRIAAEQVEVVAILHGARDLPAAIATRIAGDQP